MRGWPSCPSSSKLDGAAAGSVTNGVTIVEVRHPLASGDVAHDIQLAPGDIVWLSVGVVLFVNTGGEQQGSGLSLPVMLRIVVVPDAP